jgi:hypothetical protein
MVSNICSVVTSISAKDSFSKFDGLLRVVRVWPFFLSRGSDRVQVPRQVGCFSYFRW